MTSCFPGLRSRSGLLAAAPSAPRPPLPLRCPPPAPLQSATVTKLFMYSSSFCPFKFCFCVCSAMRQKKACHVCPQVRLACSQVLACRTCCCLSRTLYPSVSAVITLSFQALFPRLLRKCGVAVSIRLVCRKTRQAVSRVLSGMAGICLSGIFTVFFSFFCAGRPVLSSLGPAAVPRPCRIFFPSGCPVPSVIITAGLSCHCPVPWQWRRRGGGFPVVVWRCKRGRKEGLICLRTEKKKKQKKSDFF